MVGVGNQNSRSTWNGTTAITLESLGVSGLGCTYEQEINQFHTHDCSALQTEQGNIFLVYVTSWSYSEAILYCNFEERVG